MSNRTLGLPDPVYDYLLSVSVREPKLLQRLREETATLPMAMMQIAPEQGQLLSLLVQALRPKRCLEIGVFTGYSSLVVALALPPEGRIVACDISEEWTAIARRYWHEAGVDNKIDLYLAPALQTLDRMIAHGETGTFDFAFIDADKESYWGYYERALTLVRTGGMIAIDNTLWSGRPADPTRDDATTNAIRAFNQRLYKDTRVRISLVPIGDGMTLALKVRD
ncbi:MAG: class I SAM-dependent methyltransferase [Betaproteobacteria bacterium]